jgi:hypothetical protein
MRLVLLFLVLLGLVNGLTSTTSPNVADAGFNVARGRTTSTPVQEKKRSPANPSSVWASILGNAYGQVSSLCESMIYGGNSPSTTTITKTTTTYQEATVTITDKTMTVGDTIKVTVGSTYTTTNTKVTYVSNGFTVTKIVPYSLRVSQVS